MCGELTVNGNAVLYWEQEEVHPVLEIRDGGSIHGPISFYTEHGQPEEMIQGIDVNPSRFSYDGWSYTYSFS